MEQVRLDKEQIEAFYVDVFATDQAEQFARLTSAAKNLSLVVDIGGGCGYFARELNLKTGLRVRVVDMDPGSLDKCRSHNSESIEAELGDALSPTIRNDEDVVCFNLILHHLIGRDERETREIQKNALRFWLHTAQFVFVNEYIYESFIGHLSGRIIFDITRSRLLSRIGGLISRIIPSLRANTFGVGVRFRANKEWLTLFAEAGYDVTSWTRGHSEPISLARRVLLIKEIRRDSFLLKRA